MYHEVVSVGPEGEEIARSEMTRIGETTSVIFWTSAVGAPAGYESVLQEIMVKTDEICLVKGMGVLDSFL